MLKVVFWSLFEYCLFVCLQHYEKKNVNRFFKALSGEVGQGTGNDSRVCTVYPKKYAHGFCFAVLCCGSKLTDFPIPTRLTSLALWQSNDCPSASKATLMNMDKYFMRIHYERLHNHNKAKHNKTVCIFIGINCKQYCGKNRWTYVHEILVSSGEGPDGFSLG